MAHTTEMGVESCRPWAWQVRRHSRTVRAAHARVAAAVLLGVGLHLVGDVVAIIWLAGNATSETGDGVGTAVGLVGWGTAGLVMLVTVGWAYVRVLGSGDGVSSESTGDSHALPAAPPAEATADDGVADGSPPLALVPLVRRILTLATIRAGTRQDDWAWLEVEREAMRLLAALDALPGAACRWSAEGELPRAILDDRSG